MSSTPIPYGRQWIDEEDVAAVVAALRSDWLTTGPRVAEFEQAFARFTGSAEAVAVSSGTAALHGIMYAAGIGAGDEVIVPAMTFAASANCVVYQGGKPVFADVKPDTLLLDPDSVISKITARTRAIVAVDYAGHPCDYDALRQIATDRNLLLVADACHSLGGSYKGRPVGSLAAMSAFSLHPVKPITTGEGGMITTDDPELARRLRTFRNHGITTDHRQREQQGSWFYEMTELGYNYRLTDLQCALGLSQLVKLPAWVERRQAIAARYSAAFSGLDGISSLTTHPQVSHACHLYVVRLDKQILGMNRSTAFAQLREQGILVNVHYVPVYLHPFYRRQFGTRQGQCPVVEEAYEQVLSLPVFPHMSDSEASRVIDAVKLLVEVSVQ
ncbi:MAG: UDP-4-amino-4,6-dideoxy-N-acetyl-beta-L-altrosamine transaminase [Deltaproteobacteria bacterium]|nr:UDP-4-amino-4,6-dideoxy-N-acetyl-beta-L-altrosamine transaminase [Deltaproteobacteria bacterium]